MGSPRRTRSMTRSLHASESATSSQASTKTKSNEPTKKRKLTMDQAAETVIDILLKDPVRPRPSGSTASPPGNAAGSSRSAAGPPRNVPGPSGSSRISTSVSSVRGSEFRSNKGKKTTGETGDMYDLEARANSLMSPFPSKVRVVLSNERDLISLSNRQRGQPTNPRAKTSTTRGQKKKDQTREERPTGSSGEPKGANLGVTAGSRVKKYLKGNIKNLCESNEESDES